MKHRIKGLYYCQYLVGVGHFLRSLTICRSLIKKFEVDFLLGGDDVNFSFSSPHFHLLQLPPVGPFNASGQISDINVARRLKYIKTLTTPYDFFMTEMFPFSKWQFKEEIESLIVQLKELNPRCIIACSLRDSLPTYASESEIEILNFIEKFYDVIFVHSDPRVYKLEESFSLAPKLGDKVFYTGFIVRKKRATLSKKRQKRIVISLGAGSFGEELISAVLKIVCFFPDYHFVFIKGPKASLSFLNELERLVAPIQNAELVSFIDHFPEYLSQSALSISLGGYTIIDIAYTKTPAIVYPSTFYDQYVRALKFAGFGFLKIITREDLLPHNLKEVIERALHMSTSPFDVEMSGAKITALELDKLIKMKRKN
jgi:predicted glycosyltransferase